MEVNYQQSSYLTIIGMHLTMHLMHPNYCQITIMYVCVHVHVHVHCMYSMVNHSQFYHMALFIHVYILFVHVCTGQVHTVQVYLHFVPGKESTGTVTMLWL